MQRTLVVLKPDAVRRGLVGRVITRIEEAGLKIVGVKMVMMDDDLTRRHYADLEERLGTAIYESNARFMRSGPVVALVVDGVESVRNVRRLVGSTYPSEAPPGTIRGDFAHQSRDHCDAEDRTVYNLVHASGNVEEAAYEVELWFGAQELTAYRTVAESLTF